MVHPSVLNPGSTVDLTFERGTLTEGAWGFSCTVAEVVGDWVRCRPADSFAADREQQWYDLKRVVQITKHEK
jgi:hypothetical protein